MSLVNTCFVFARWIARREQPGLTASEVIAYPAVRLFAERVSARRGEFSLRDDEAPMVAEICRKLDGIPLAIELAAGRVAIFGVANTVGKTGFAP